MSITEVIRLSENLGAPVWEFSSYSGSANIVIFEKIYHVDFDYFVEQRSTWELFQSIADRLIIERFKPMSQL